MAPINKLIIITIYANTLAHVLCLKIPKSEINPNKEVPLIKDLPIAIPKRPLIIMKIPTI